VDFIINFKLFNSILAREVSAVSLLLGIFRDFKKRRICWLLALTTKAISWKRKKWCAATTANLLLGSESRLIRWRWLVVSEKTPTLL